MKLFVIFNEDTTVSIKQVSITKETDKQVSIKCDGISRKILAKTAIGTYLKEGHIYAESAEEALQIWNEYHANLAKSLKEQADFASSLIASTPASSLIK